MLFYSNPNFENIFDEGSVLDFRKKDWESVPLKIKEFFSKICSLSELKIVEFDISKCYAHLRKEINDTDLDYKINVTLYNGLNNCNIKYNFLIPRMTGFGFVVNGVKRFLIFQITDKHVIKRNNQIRINSCLKNIIINKKEIIKEKQQKDSYNFFYSPFKNKKIPLFLIIFTKYDFNDIYDKFKIKLSYNKDNKNINFFGDIIDIDYSECDNNIYKQIFDDIKITTILNKNILNNINVIKNTDLYNQYIIDNYDIDLKKYFNEIFEIDIFLKKFSKKDNIIDEIIYGLDLEEEHNLDLKTKRLRISEYILGYIFNDIYNSMFLNIKNIKKDMKRNYNINELLSGKFQELFQMSKVEDNLIGKIMELYKLTLSGPGGIPKESVTLDKRNINNSFYGYIDPIFTSDGENCGIVNYLTLTCKLDQDGCFI